MAALDFDATTVDPATEFKPLPDGEYKVAIIESELKPTKKNDGSYLQCKLQVLDGEFKGRTLFERLNLNNSNGTAVEIAKKTLSAICHAVGVLQPKDSSQLHNRPMVAKVKVVPRKDTPGEFSNEIKAYKSLKDATASVAPATAGAAPWN
jgi:hypothetical protein